MRTLFVLVVWVASLASAASGEGVQMAGKDDVIHLADMAAPPWSASANELVTSDRAGLEPCEQLVERLAARIGDVSQRTYTTSPRWRKIQRARITPESGGAQTLVTCWADADGRASVVVKIDDGEP